MMFKLPQMSRHSSAILVLAAMLCGCGGSSGRVCFTTGEACDDFLSANFSPEARISVPDEVVAGETVFLDGGRSRDPDGRIESYRWFQTAGPPIAIESAESEVASFIAPAVDVDTQVSVRLTVRDDEDASDSTRRTITIVPRRQAAIALGWALLAEKGKPLSIGGLEKLLSPNPSANILTTGHQRSAYHALWLSLLAHDPLRRSTPFTLTEAQDQARVLLNRLLLDHSSAWPPRVKVLVSQGLRDLATIADPGIEDQIARLSETLVPELTAASVPQHNQRNEAEAQAIDLLLEIGGARTSIDWIAVAQATHLLIAIEDAAQGDNQGFKSLP